MVRKGKIAAELVVWVLVISTFIGVVVYRSWKLFFDSAPAVHTIKPKEDPVLLPPEPVPDLVNAKPAPGPLTFWSGEVIIGRGPDRGKLELLAHSNFKSVVLTADQEGKCWFDQIDGLKPGEMYIRLQKRGQAPLMCITLFDVGKEIRLWPVQQMTQRAKEGKWGPKLMPHVDPLLERVTYQKGQVLYGLTWSVRTLPGKDPTKGSDLHWDLPPPLAIKKVDFNPRVINLVDRYASAEVLANMAAADEKSAGKYSQNNHWDFATSVGNFQIVSSCDRYSANPKARNGGGRCFSILLLPNGKVITGALGISTVIETDSSIFLIGRTTIYKWLGGDKVQQEVDFLDRFAAGDMPFTSPNRGLMAGKYIPVNTSSESNFGGLLEYAKGTWRFHVYDGDYGSFVEAAEKKEDHVVLTLYGKQQIRFNPKDGTFTDL